ncbi:hypothetical protein F2B00_34065, partial [Streptomyces parvus]
GGGRGGAGRVGVRGGRGGAGGLVRPHRGFRGSAPGPAPQSPEGLELVARRRGKRRPLRRKCRWRGRNVSPGGADKRQDRQPSFEMSRTAPRSALVAIAA